MLGSFWRLCRLKLVPRSSSNRLNFEKAICHEIIGVLLLFCVCSPKFAIQSGRRSLPDGSKIVLGRFCFLMISRFGFWSFGVSFGTVLGSQMGLWERMGFGKSGPWAVQVRFLDPLGLLWGPSWGTPGPFLGRRGVSWARFGVLRALFPFPLIVYQSVSYDLLV